MTRKSWLACFLSLVCLVLLSACGKGKPANTSDKPVVYTSFYPVNDLVEQVAGETVEVRSFMPLDKDPHLWEPSPKDIASLAGADLLIVNGANLESWVDQVEENLDDLKILKLSDSVELISYKGAAVMGDFQYMCQQQAEKDSTYKISFGHTHEDCMRVTFIKRNSNESLEDLIVKGKKIMEKKGKAISQGSTIEVDQGQVYSIEMGHEHGEIYYKFPEDGHWVFISDRISEPLLSYDLKEENGSDLEIDRLLEGSTSNKDKVTYDPHSWLSLKNAKKYLNAIQNALTDLYPNNQRLYYRNKVGIVDELTDLELAYREKFKDLDRREFVVTHYAYEYLARDFDLIQFPLQGLVSTESPSLKTIAKAIAYCKVKDIKTIFYEEGNDPKSALSLAEEIDGEAIGLTSMEYRTKEMNQPGSYQIIMKENLEKLYKSLVEEG